jgi:hypothetical protein
VIADLKPLPRGTVAALERAVRMAAEWRGHYTHDADALAAFDAEIAQARAALAAVRAADRNLKRITKHMKEVLAAAGHHVH